MQYPLDNTLNSCPFVVFQSYIMKGTQARTDIATVETVPSDALITLYIPDNFSETVGSTWGSEDIFDIYNKIEGGTGAISKKLSEKTPKAVSSIKAQTGKAFGPTDLLLFQKPNPFSLTFNYNFVPRNAKEAKEVIQIINTFKKKVLPKWDKAVGVGYLSFPEIWGISFWNIMTPGSPVTPQQYINMALTNVGISYSSGAASILVFKDSSPVQVGLTLSFQSIEYPALPPGA